MRVSVLLCIGLACVVTGVAWPQDTVSVTGIIVRHSGTGFATHLVPAATGEVLAVPSHPGDRDYLLPALGCESPPCLLPVSPVTLGTPGAASAVRSMTGVRISQQQLARISAEPGGQGVTGRARVRLSHGTTTATDFAVTWADTLVVGSLNQWDDGLTVLNVWTNYATPAQLRAALSATQAFRQPTLAAMADSAVAKLAPQR